ncbi:MAG: DNA-processing protein DprA [Selenomonadaceae bacterium]|nr:DNA-processing protein DprA [Selenomonadaceae bacterium]
MERHYMAALGGAEKIGAATINKLVKFFGSAKAAWLADEKELISSGIIQEKAANTITEFKKEHPDAPQKNFEYCRKHGIKLCAMTDEDYPTLLKEIDTAPPFFYYRGKLEPNAQRIGIVGSRVNTPYGEGVALELARNLAAVGFTIVSGAAKGIDTFAHRGALESGRTVAVLGSGINHKQSREKEKLLEAIAENGAVISEYPPLFNPTKNTWAFPLRNRIIAGLSRGVVVVEAGKKSGALITTGYAGKYGRTVFAIPGQIYSEKSVGCNELIRDGGTLIKGFEDILSEFNVVYTPKDKTASEKTIPDDLSENAVAVLKIIPYDKYISDEEILMKMDELDPSDLTDIMLDLDLNDLIEENSGRYIRKR